METCGIDFHGFLEQRSLDALLPWDRIETGVRKDYLIGEAQKAQEGLPPKTADQVHAAIAAYATENPSGSSRQTNARGRLRSLRGGEKIPPTIISNGSFSAFPKSAPPVFSSTSKSPPL